VTPASGIRGRLASRQVDHVQRTMSSDLIVSLLPLGFTSAGCTACGWPPHSNGAEIRDGRCVHQWNLRFASGERSNILPFTVGMRAARCAVGTSPEVLPRFLHSRYVRKCHSLASVRAHFDSKFYRCEWIRGDRFNLREL